MNLNPRLISLATATPPHVVRQADVKQLAAQLFAAALDPSERLLDVFENAEIEQRHTCVPLDWLGRPHSFGERNDLYIEHATQLGIDVAGAALAEAELSARDVDHIVFVSSTGIATPSTTLIVAFGGTIIKAPLLPP